MPSAASPESRVRTLLSRMTLDEKIGQLILVNGAGGTVPQHLRDGIAGGGIGAVLNEVHVETVNELQRIAVEESRLGIPLLVGRDVIHGFRTVFPIPLGQAASWNPEIVRACARVAAREAAASGVNWTYAPMLDIGRDPRWGRIAETLGEDPFLSGELGAAMVRGFQGDDLSQPGSIAACAKHFAGYGASEGGRDYNTTNIPENELRNVHLPPFRAAVAAGAASVMTSFSDLNGIPCTANDLLLRTVLREEWGFDGLVVSDWDSVSQLAVHGLTATDAESAYEAARAGLDMEMAGGTYAAHLRDLVTSGRISPERVDAMAANVLRVKFRMGLFETPFRNPSHFPPAGDAEALAVAKTAALQSAVLLRNEGGRLPLSREGRPHIACIGPLADDGYEQLGTWIFDGDPGLSRNPLQALREAAGDGAVVRHARGLKTTRDRGREGFAEAVALARDADVAVLFLGEEAILSGEAHCRADIRLPGNQEALLAEIAATGTPVVLVLMAGRPLALQGVVEQVDAVLYVWHPGTMAGLAIADLLFGDAVPSGKLPVTFPRMTGQIPIYYAHKNTGKPATPESVVLIDDIDPRAPQLSVGNTSFYLDAGHTPLYPFGYGLSYSEFRYEDIRVSAAGMGMGETIEISADLINAGDREAEEVVQLYVRDLVGSVTRPVKELKGFQRHRLVPGERRRVTFRLHTDDLAFCNRAMRWVCEPGDFRVWIGGSSTTGLETAFAVQPPTDR